MAYVVRITEGKVGFPEGIWQRLCYLAVAKDAAARLRAEGIKAVVMRDGCTCGGCKSMGCEACHGQSISLHS